MMLMVHECGRKGQENMLSGRVQGQMVQLTLSAAKREKERGVLFPIHILSRAAAR